MKLYDVIKRVEQLIEMGKKVLATQGFEEVLRVRSFVMVLCSLNVKTKDLNFPFKKSR